MNCVVNTDFFTTLNVNFSKKDDDGEPLIIHQLVGKMKKYKKLFKQQMKENSRSNEMPKKGKQQHQNKTVLNFSDIIILQKFVLLLLKGLDFKVASENIQVIDFICDIEEYVKNIFIKVLANEFKFE